MYIFWLEELSSTLIRFSCPKGGYTQTSFGEIPHTNKVFISFGSFGEYKRMRKGIFPIEKED